MRLGLRLMSDGNGGEQQHRAPQQEVSANIQMPKENAGVVNLEFQTVTDINKDLAVWFVDSFVQIYESSVSGESLDNPRSL